MKYSITKNQWLDRAKNANLNVYNVINGQSESVAVESSPTAIDKYSPRDGSLLYRFSEGCQTDVNRAVANAHQAFNDGRWRQLSLSKRAAVLNKLADLVEQHKEELALYECLDVGKTITKALRDDICRTTGALRNTASLGGQLFTSCGADLGSFAYQRRKPIGVVGAIVGWNYPLTSATKKLAPALMMGNCIVLKPSEFTSLSACYLAILAIEAGVPPGVFNVVNGAGHIVGAALAEHPAVDLLSFVGSSATGKRIMTAGGQSNMKRLLLECGGKSPYIVFDDCPNDLDFIAQDIVSKAFPNQGAVCVAGTRLLLQASIADKLLPLIIDKAASVTPSDPLDPQSTFGAIVNEAHMNKVLAYIESGIDQGAELVQGGRRCFPSDDRKLKQGFYIWPTIFNRVDPQAKIAQEEIFGPVLSITSFSDEAEAIYLANNVCYGLSSYVATTNLGRAQRLGERINSGSLTIIGSTNLSGDWVGIGSDKHKQSGMGYSGGLEGLAAYSITTTVRVCT